MNNVIPCKKRNNTLVKIRACLIILKIKICHFNFKCISIKQYQPEMWQWP